MTGPKDPSIPEGEDWGFPEVDPASPTSVDMPVSDAPEQIIYDTGSDAWWRAQAAAQRQATEGESLGAPPAGSPLDRDWLPPALAAHEPPVVPDPAAVEVEHSELLEPPTPEPEPEPLEPLEPEARASFDEPAYVEPAAYVEEPEPAVAAPVPPVSSRATPSRPAVSDLGPVIVPLPPVSRPPHEGARVSPARALAGAAIALAGVALGIGALFLFNSKDDLGSPAVDAGPRSTVAETTAPTAPPTPSATSTRVPSAKPTAPVAPPVVAPTTAAQAPVVPVSVLNNSKIKGLADRGAARFKAGGWPVRLTGNYRGGTIARTTVYYAAGGEASAQRFAKQFGIPRVAPRFAGLPTTGMTVVLTRDYR